MSAWREKIWRSFGQRSRETKDRITVIRKELVRVIDRITTAKVADRIIIARAIVRKKTSRTMTAVREGGRKAVGMVTASARIIGETAAATIISIRTIGGRADRTIARTIFRRSVPVVNGTIIESEEVVREGNLGKMTMREVPLKANERIDDLQRNGYQIIQNPEKFCFGMDAVLLTGFAYAGKKDMLLDLGTGTGIIPILMEAKYHPAHLTGLEIQEESADMARRSVALNGLSDTIDIVTGDIREAGSQMKSASFDCITCNPPYMIEQHGLTNPEAPKAIARHEILCTLEDVVNAAAKLLKPGGHFFMVHRPFRLAEIMTTLSQYGLEPKRMRLVYPYVDKEPNMVLLEAVRGGKPRMTVEKPLIIFESAGVYTEEIRRDYGF